MRIYADCSWLQDSAIVAPVCWALKQGLHDIPATPSSNWLFKSRYVATEQE
jgi:hypothetical protein